MLPTPHIFELDPDSLRENVAAWQLPRYRADQVLDWVYQRHVAQPERMTNISKADRETLAHRLRFVTGKVVRHQRATDGVQKLLLDWPAGEGEPSGGQSECVVIPSEGSEKPEADGGPARVTACLSSQVGCPVGCTFCASGLGGLERNLTAGQIVEQAWQLGLLPGVGRVSHVVFMGMGEPLANFENVAQAVRAITSPWGLGISARRVTISTVGLPSQIRRLAHQELPITLAISLHAPNDQLRRKLIPWARYVTVEQLVEAGRYYFEKTGREVTFEYTLLRGVNDQPQHARELARLARTLRANVNLIRYNEVATLPFNRPDTDDVRHFQAILRSAGVNSHIRASRGRDIAAACGQLRHEQTVQVTARDVAAVKPVGV